MSTQHAMVTGASEGIGRAFAKKLATKGYAITLVARNEARLKELTGELGGSGHSFVVADLSTDAGMDTIAHKLGSQHHQVLINNAGSGNYGKYHKITLAKHRAMLQLNCMALAHLSHAFLSHAKSGDALVNVSSMLAFLPLPGSALYAASKSFVTSFSESLWYENKDRDVYVLGLCPGLTTSEFNRRAGGEDMKAPAMMVQSAERVADIGYAALCNRKKPTVMCGEINHVMAGVVSRLMPRKAVVAMMGAARAPN